MNNTMVIPAFDSEEVDNAEEIDDDGDGAATNHPQGVVLHRKGLVEVGEDHEEFDDDQPNVGLDQSIEPLGVT